MYTKVKKAQEIGVRCPITIDVAIKRDFGEHAGDFIGYIVLQGRSKVSILIDNWHDVEKELKDAIWKMFRYFMICLQVYMIIYFLFNTNNIFIV